MEKYLTPVTPGDILKEEFLEPLGITQSQLARAIHVPANRISQIVKGKREISVDTALRLGRFFNLPPEFWLNLQQRFSLKIMERQLGDKIQNEIPVYSV